MKIKLLFEPRDFWIGVYWKRRIMTDNNIKVIQTTTYTFYVCLIPMFPIKIQFARTLTALQAVRKRRRQERKWLSKRRREERR